MVTYDSGLLSWELDGTGPGWRCDSGANLLGISANYHDDHRYLRSKPALPSVYARLLDEFDVRCLSGNNRTNQGWGAVPAGLLRSNTCKADINPNYEH